MASWNNRRRQHDSPSKVSQQYIFLVNIDLTRHCKYAGCTNKIFMDLNDRVVLGCYAKHTTYMKCFTREVASTGSNNKLTCPCCKEKKKEFTYHQQSFSHQ